MNNFTYMDIQIRWEGIINQVFVKPSHPSFVKFALILFLYIGKPRQNNLMKTQNHIHNTLISRVIS